jgi:hypothetical protein
LGYNKYMGILDNFENAWDVDFQEEPKAPEFESNHIPRTDNMGRETWEQVGKTYTPPNPLWLEDKWATKIFKEDVCNNCSCKEE